MPQSWRRPQHHQRQMHCEPKGGLFPLFPKTGNVNAQQQNAALCQKRPNALQQK